VKENMKPCAYKQLEHYFYSVTVCLLKNEPASYRK